MPKQGVVGIALNVDYDKALKEMVSGFNQALTQITNRAKKIEYAGDVKEQIKGIKGEIKGFADNFRSEIDKINSQQIDGSNFKEFETKVTQNFENIEKKFASLNTKIYDLKTQLGLLDGSDFASKMKKQFNEVTKSVLGTYEGLQQVLALSKNQPDIDLGSGRDKSNERHIRTLEFIKRIKSEIKSIDGEKFDKKFDFIGKYVEKGELLERQIDAFKRLNQEIKSTPQSSPEYGRKENMLIRIQAAAEKTRKYLLALDDAFSNYKNGATLFDDRDMELIDGAQKFGANVDSFVLKVEKMSQSVKTAKNSLEQIQGEFNTFQIKDGAIHVPIDIATSNDDLKAKFDDIVAELKRYAENKPVIARVKLTLDNSSSKGYEKNSEIDKQQVDGQNEPALDITSAIRKSYREAAREAKKIVKTEMATIEKEFESVPIKIKPDTDAFKNELKAMIDESFKIITKGATGLNVNKELEKLINNLKEISTSLSGNENFKFGLDEDSIGRIASAIKDMADMIQRAFGVASNDDIAAQWTTIESKFKDVAGEEGKLLKGNKEHKVAIQELAVEYKKYLDMGGKNDLSALTEHKQTIKNITTEYENLGKAAQEAAQKQERTKKKTAPTKISSEEKEAINAVSRENKKLETQAGKTGTALENEGKSAQAAAEKFRKLAKEKGAAVYANRELAKAAKETADALDREAKARKESGAKPGKNAVDGNVYSSNFLKWESDIKQSLADSGNYADVYEAKISQATNGTVKFTAVVRTLDGELRKFSAGVKDTGEMFSPSVSEMGEKQAADFEKRLKVAEKVREAIAAMDGDGVEPIRLDKSEIELYSKEIQKILDDLGELSNRNYRLDITNDGKLLIAKKEISDTGTEAKALTATIDRIDDIFEETAEDIVVSSSKIEQALNGAFGKIKVSTSIKDLASSAQKAFDVFKEKAKRDSNFSGIESDLESLRQKIAGIGSQEDLIKFNQDLKDLGVTLKNIGKENKLNAETRTFKDINELRDNLNSLFASVGKVNEKSIKITGTDKLTAEVKAANGEIHKMSVSLDSKGFARFVDTGIVEFGRLKAAAQKTLKSIQSMVRIYLSPQDFIRYFGQGFNAVKEIDTAMTELRKVSDASPDALASYFGDAVKSAKELGSSVKDMISATADWSRNGFNLSDSKELAEVAVLYKNVGDGIDIDAANESLVSTLQGFQMEASEAESIIDSFNEVSNNFSISSAGIGEALKRSAAAFNAANTDLNQSIALITAGNEIVQSPEKVGTMWQTVSARIRGKILCPLHSNMQTTYEDNIRVA